MAQARAKTEEQPQVGEKFTDWEVGKNAARELALRAEEVAEGARLLAPDDARKLEMMRAAAAALSAAAPFLDPKDRRRFAA